MSTKRVSSFIFRIILPAAVLCLIAAAVVSCGHKHSSGAPSTVGAPLAAPRADLRPAPTTGNNRSLGAILRDIDAYAPTGVDAARLATLKTELKKLLQARSKDGKTISIAPTGPDNAVDDLAAMSNQQGTKANVVWTEKLKGDYNNDGVVDIRDITPIAQYYGQWTNGGSVGPERLIDGDASPLIDIGDLAAIAANYGARIQGYQVWRGHWNGASVDWETTMRPNPNAANPNWSADRPTVPPANARPPYGYMDDISGVADKTNVRYKVVPYGDGAAGVESNISALSGSGLAASPWPKVHGDVRNSGLSSAVGPQTNALKWNYKAWAYDSPVIGEDGTVYVRDSGSNVLAIDSADGTLKWEAQTSASGNYFATSLAIGANGTVYVGCGDGNLYALNAGNGSLKWTLPTGGPTMGDMTIGPDGVVYFGSGVVSVSAVNPDGTLKWSYDAGNNVFGAPAFGADGTLYVIRGALNNLDTRGLFALNSTDGSLKWQAQVSGLTPVVGADGSLYVVGDRSGYGLFCLNSSDGSIRWSLYGGDYTSLATGPDGTIYVKSDSAICALDPATGTLEWAFGFNSRLQGSSSSPAVGADGTVYVADGDGVVFALSPMDGSVKWKYATGASIESSPAIGADGSLYIGCDDGRLYAFGVGPKFSVSGAVTGPSGGLAGVLVTLMPGKMSATTFADGTYQIPSVPNGTYTVMPMETGYSFSPLYPSVTVSNADAVQDFTATPGGLALAPWPKLHGTAGNTGLSPYVGSQTNHIRWRRDLGSLTDVSPIIGAGGILYICAGPSGELMALDTRDGSLIWDTMNGEFAETPAIGTDGTIYTPHNSGLACVDAANPADGTQIWIGILRDLAKSVAIGLDGTVLVEAGDMPKTVHALYPADGTTLWNGQMQLGLPSCPAVATDGTIYAAGGYVDAFDRTGNSKWSTMLGDSAHPDFALISPSIGPNGDVYVKAVNNSSYELSLYALNGSDGTVKWKFSTGTGSTTTSMSVPAVGPDGTIYFGSEDHYVYALNPADGSLKWKHLTGGEVLSSAAIGADNTVYICSDDSNVYALNGTDGSIKWVCATSSWIHSSPAIGADGTVYVMTHSGTLYAFGP